MLIRFDGKVYEFDVNALYDGKTKGKIILPDGRVLKVAGGWLESLPPRPEQLVLLKTKTKAAPTAKLVEEYDESDVYDY